MSLVFYCCVFCAMVLWKMSGSPSLTNLQEVDENRKLFYGISLLLFCLVYIVQGIVMHMASLHQGMGNVPVETRCGAARSIIINIRGVVLFCLAATFALPAVWYFTSPYDGLQGSSFPPPGWKPPFRIVISFTTTPNRLTKVGNAIESLKHQSLHGEKFHQS